MPTVFASYGKPLKIIFLANVAILYSAFFIISGVRYFDYDGLVREGVPTQGQIAELNCSQHNAFTYLFSVNNRVHKGHGNGGNGNQECTALKTGDTILVYYLAKNDSVFTDGNPSERRDNEKSSMTIAGVVLPLFMFAAWKFIRF